MTVPCRFTIQHAFVRRRSYPQEAITRIAMWCVGFVLNKAQAFNSALVRETVVTYALYDCQTLMMLQS